MTENKPQEKWYFKTSTLVVAFLAVGPLALPLLWLNPRFSMAAKIITSIIVILLSYYIGIAFVNGLKSINNYYQQIFQMSF